MIPKIIHQIWFQGLKNLPEEHKNKRESWKRLNPHFEYMLWDNESMLFIISTLYPQYLNTYNNFKYMHQKIDFFKYIVLYAYGGIYADMDTINLKPLDSLLNKYKDSEIIVGKLAVNNLESFLLSGRSQTINNGIIMGVKGHKLFEELIKNINNDKIYLSKYSEINNTTGPSFFTEIVNKLKNDKITILDSDYLEPCYSKNPYCVVSKKAYADHQHSQSWVDGGLLNLATLYYFLKRNTWILVFPVIYYLVKKTKKIN